MSVQTQIFGHTYPKVTDTVNRVQDLAMEGMLGVDLLPGSANMQNQALARIEFHVPITETSPYSFGNFRKLSLYNCFMPI